MSTIKAWLKWLFCLLTIFAALSCRPTLTVSPELSKLPQPKPPEGYTPPPSQPIPVDGENCCGQFSADQQKVYFLSRRRARHEQFQVYVYDFSKKLDRRLSYHDGDDQGLDVTASHIYYASTTDALKERPAFLAQALGQTPQAAPNLGRRPLWSLDSFDLYRTNLEGTNIERLTARPGFDGEIAVSPKDGKIIYTSVRESKSQLIERSAMGGERVFQASTQNDSQAAIAPNGKDVAWVRYQPDLNTASLWIQTPGKKAASLTAQWNGMIWSPTWHPSQKEIVFSSNHEDAKNFELYVIKSDGTCLRRLTYALGQDILPRFSPNGQQLLFTSDISGSHQIYIQDYRPPACL